MFGVTVLAGIWGNLMHCWMECKVVWLLWRVIFTKILKNTFFGPPVPLIGIYSTYITRHVQKGLWTRSLIAVLFTVAKPLAWGIEKPLKGDN